MYALANQRSGARLHNALCAFVAGYAMARQKQVVLLQDEEAGPTPIDYRDVVKTFHFHPQITHLVKPTLDRVYDILQTGRVDAPEVERLGVLQHVDLGDVRGRERRLLVFGNTSFQPGRQYNARRGHARLVVGRKGRAKTAIFYEVRSVEGRGLDRLVLDLRPEGHQFLRLREFVEQAFQGAREYALTAFWTYILLSEIARKLLEVDERVAQRDPGRMSDYRALQTVYDSHDPGGQADLRRDCTSRSNELSDNSRRLNRRNSLQT